MSQITFEIISDEEKAKEFWELFSPHKTIDDEWDFRYSWVSDFNFPYHFIVGYDQQKPIGLLPLTQNTLKGLGPKFLQQDKPFLEFFGGIDTDNNQIFLKPGYEQHIEDFLKQIKSTALLTDLLYPYKLDNISSTHETDKFEADLTNLGIFEDFLSKNFSSKSKGKLLNKIRFLYKNHQIQIQPGTIEDLKLLFKFSIQKFEELSSFSMEDRQKTYLNIFKNFPNDLFVIYLDYKPSAIAFCLIHKNTYILLNVGYDHENRDIGKLLVVTQIQRAIDKGCTKYDAGKGDNGWKERFHLKKTPQYKLILNP